MLFKHSTTHLFIHIPYNNSTMAKEKLISKKQNKLRDDFCDKIDLKIYISNYLWASI